MIFAAYFILRGRDTHINFLESIFLSRVEGQLEGRGFHVEGEGTMSRVTFFFSKFLRRLPPGSK